MLEAGYFCQEGHIRTRESTGLFGLMMNLVSQGSDTYKLRSSALDVKGTSEQVINMLAPTTRFNIRIVSKLDPG